MEYETDSKKSFSNLTNTYISRASTATGLTNADTGLLALFFLRLGSYTYSNGDLGTRGAYGYYWSLRGLSGTDANYLYFSSTYVSPQRGNARGYGFAVRCLAR